MRTESIIIRLAPALAILLAGCATPGVLKTPPSAPTMAEPVPVNPVPDRVTAPSSPTAEPQ